LEVEKGEANPQYSVLIKVGWNQMHVNKLKNR
jgi:hypothetical protein